MTGGMGTVPVFYDLEITRDYRGDPTAVILRTPSYASALKHLDTGTSRSIWTDGEVVVKIDRQTPQAQREAETWLNVAEEDRHYFATPLQVGPDYIIQEFVHLDKNQPGLHEAYILAEELFHRYGLMWDWQGWNQFGIDVRTGLLCIHDYCALHPEGTSHEWTTLNIAGSRGHLMLFGCVKSGNVSFCSIECARHNGCEPTRFFLNGEQIGEVCAGCGVELDTGEPSHSVE